MGLFGSVISFTFATTVSTSVGYAYLLSAVLFIFGLKMLTNLKTAQMGNTLSSVGMLTAAIATLFLVNQGAGAGEDYRISFIWIAVAVGLGAAAGWVLAQSVAMTAMPQMVALLNGFGGIASLLVASAEYLRTSHPEQIPGYLLLATGLAVLIGGITFTGSLVAFGKLQGLITSSPILFAVQKVINAMLLLVCLALMALLVVWPQQASVLASVVVLSLLLGVLLVIPIGGADMPVVISLLNSYSGVAASMAGFVLGNMALIITGALVGASGMILTHIMCKAMNRSLVNVLFGGVGGATGPSTAKGHSADTVREFSIEDGAVVLEAARQVVIGPRLWFGGGASPTHC